MKQMFKSWSSMIAALLLLFITPSLCQGQKIDGKVDLVVMVPNFDPYPEVARDWKNAVLHHLPQHFEIGEQKTRVAIIDMRDVNEAERVVLNLTGDRATFENVLRQWTRPLIGESQVVDASFKAARERLFDFDNAERARIAIGIMYQVASNRRKAKEEAMKLRNKGVSIYVISTGYRDDAENYTGGDPTKVIEADDSGKFHTEAPALLEKMAKVIFRDLCGWDTTCRYPDAGRSRCEPKTFRPKVSIGHNIDPNNSCDAHKPSDRTCAADDDCVKECDQRWAWSRPLPNCNVTCGVVVKRKTTTPPEEMENCLAEVQCQPCSTTTAAATTTPESGMQHWVIGVIVAAIILLLLIIALIVFLVVRKNRAAAAARAAEAMKKQKMAMEAASKSKMKVPLVKAEEVAVDWAPIMKGAQASVAADISVVGKSRMSSMAAGGKSTTSKKPGGGSIANVKKSSVMTAKKTPALSRK